MRQPATVRSWITILIVCLTVMTGVVSNAAQLDSRVDNTTLPNGGDKVPDELWDSASHARASREQEISERFRQAVMMLHAGQYDFAVTALHRVLELSPKMPEAHVNMGFALLGQGHPEVAREFFLGAIDLRPRQVNAYWGLAVSLEALCDLKGATGAMRTYLHLADADDRFLGKARAAIWEWEAEAGKEGIEQNGDGTEAVQQQSACVSASG